MINNATFQIIGRIASIKATDKVTHINIASDRQVKDKDGNWTAEANWNSVTVFNEALRKRLTNEKVGKKGNQVIFQGSIQSGSYKKDGKTVYQTNLVAQDFDVLSFAKDGE
jgi:single-strand DNA-binding protein